MKTRNLIFTALTALALVALAGCSSETELLQEAPDPTLPEGMTRIDFAIKGVKTGTSYADPTVGLEEHERTMKDVTAYLFKMGDGQTVPADADKVVSIVAATSMTNGKGSLIMPAGTKAGTYSVVFVANKACFAAALNSVAKDVTTYGELNAIETLSNTDIMAGLSATPADNKGLPMRALTNGVIVPASGGKVEIRADFSRPLSRFDIDNEAVHSFTIASVALVNGRNASPLNAPGNAPGTPNKVAGATVANINYPTLISDVNAKFDPPVNGKVTKLCPAFYAAPGLAEDATSLQVIGKLRVGLGEVDRTYTIALKSKADGSAITIGANKRYGVTLKMTAGGDIIADIEMDLGNWGDDDEAITDVPKDVYFVVAPTTVSAGASYTESTHTFEVTAGAGGAPITFRFEMLSTLPEATIATDGTVVTGVAPVTVTPGTRAADPNHGIYEVTVAGVDGATGTFTFTTKDGMKNFVFKVKVIDNEATYPVNGVDERAILLGNIYWAPVNVGAISSLIPGEMFQFGRMSSWLDSKTIMKNIVGVSILPSEAEAAKYKGKYITKENDSNRNWWTWDYSNATEESASAKALVARWDAVSKGDGLHPCPKNWRLPTYSEARALLNASHTTGDLNDDVATATVQGVTFTSKEYYSCVEGERDRGSRYWLSGGEFTVSNGSMLLIECYKNGANKTILDVSSFPRASSDANYVRCVKDKVVAAP